MVNEKSTQCIDKIGVFGGTFDPVHIGHTQSAEAVAQELNLKKVLFIPAHIPPHKSDMTSAPTASAEQRSIMVELACKENRLFDCDKRELQRQQHSYTVDTLIELKQEFPDQSLCFIIGMDSLHTFTRWHRYQEILTLCNLVVNRRPNYKLSQMNEATKKLLLKHQIHNINELNNTNNGAIFFAKPLNIDISSTQIRYNLQRNKPCQSQVFPSVLDFINKNKLYR